MQAKERRRNKHLLLKSFNKTMESIVGNLNDDPILLNYLSFEKNDDNTLTLGRYKVIRTDRKTYNIVSLKTNNTIHKDIYSFDAAMALVENMNVSNRKHFVEQIVKEEQSYCNYYNELLHIEHTLKTADSEVAHILENRYELAKSRLEKSAERIRRFRILKV